MGTQIATTGEELARVLDRSRAGFAVKRVPAAAAAPKWRVIDGALQHESRGFFGVSGVRFACHDAVLLYQPHGALNGMLTARIGGRRCWLLQARAEPGCLEQAQYGPTLQSTPGNYLRLHGGNSSAYVESFIAYDPAVTVIDDSTQLDLGQRYLYKTKRVILHETAEPGEPRDSFVWAAPPAIYDAVGRDAFLNTDLRALIAVGPWSSREDCGELVPQSEGARRSLEAPIRPDVVGGIAARLEAPAGRGGKLIALGEVANWHASEWGWYEREPRQGFAVEFYETAAPLREVARWIQPLIRSNSEGHVALACRERNRRLEVFVRMQPERGLATALALAPSYLRYQGERGSAPEWIAAGRTWTRTRESDEGGRFFQDVSRYELVRVDDVPNFSEDRGAWLTLSELKLFLRMSNVCTIQLRAIASHLLAGA